MKKFGGIFILTLGLFLFTQTCLADATISGAVTKAVDGTVINDITIYTYDTTTGVREDYDTTDAAGLYDLTVDAGSYVVYPYHYSGDDSNIYYIRDQQTLTVVDGAVETLNFSLTRRGRIIGQIVDSSGNGIHDAYTSCENIAEYRNGSDTDYTTAGGYYYLNPYPDYDYNRSAAGYYTVWASRTGYFGSKVTNNQLADEADTTLNITLTAQSTISGTIIDSNGLVLEGALVTLDENDTSRSYSAYTDAAGNYTVYVYDTSDYNGTAVGNYILSVEKTGYITESQPFSIAADESTSIDNNFTIAVGGNLTGAVYKADGTTAISGVDIEANDSLGNTYTTTTAADGTYSLSGLRTSKRYLIEASMAGYVTKKKYNVDITAGETTADKNFKLNAARTLSGSVKTKGGSGIKDATIELFRRNKPRSSSSDYEAESGSDGSFLVSDILPGNYRVEISKNGYVTKEIKRVKLKKNKTKNYKLTKASSVYGRVTYKKKAVAGARVYIYGVKKNSNFYDSEDCDGRGYYRFNNLKKGKYKIKVESTEYATKILKKTLKKGKQKTVNIKVGPAGSISGYVTEAGTDMPLYDYVVRIKGQNKYDYTDRNGYYIIDGLSPGTYKVFIHGTAYQTQYYTGSENASGATKVKVKSNKETANINFSLSETTNN